VNAMTDTARTLAASSVRSHATGPAVATIATLADLQRHLQWAIELEHATLPPYLCALYSLDPERNAEAAEVVRSVFVEEMLHLLLAANLLNAVGGRPQIDTPQMLAPYPRSLPHADHSFEVSLLPFSAEALELFLKIEQPSAPGSEPQIDGYATIGQFYDAIEHGMSALCSRLGEENVFCGDPERQVSDAVSDGGEGRIVVVDSLDTARAALHEIVVQGEGTRGTEVWDGDHAMFHLEHDEVGHYFRFQALKLGRCYRRGDTVASGPSGHVISIDWEGVRPMEPNPRAANHPPGSRIRQAQDEFNVVYCTILQRLDQAFNGDPSMLQRAIGAMFQLKGQASALMQIPTGDGPATAGPTFEYVAPADRFQASR
jgi:Ferritin-like